jgi:periplasmic protein TonB
MKFGLFILFSISIAATACGQSKQSIWEYLDKNCLPVNDSTQATYYRMVEQIGTTYIIRDHYMTGEVEMTAECSQLKPQPIKDGKVVTYYKNGNIREEGFYELNSPSGLFKGFYENGNPKCEVFRDRKKNRITYLAYWNEAGEPLLNAGSGHVAEVVEDQVYHYEVADSVLINSYAITVGTTDTIYTFLETQPEYKGGYEKLMRDIRDNLTYPRSARRKGIDGTVYVQFVIDKEGNMVKPNVLRGIDASCGDAALYAVQKLKQWTPGMTHNKPVLVRFVLPIRFKLN